tara:strand:- start:50229 stop:50570 length:342 start_codon:yes stop_codon:yes gene_type:complete
MTDRKINRLRKAGKRVRKDASYMIVELSSWLAFNGICALGLIVLFFIALGGFQLEGFFSHLGNIASRFAEAGIERRSSFSALVMFTVLALVTIVSLLRFSSLKAILKGLSYEK